MKYRIFCKTENKHIEIESLLIKESCPNSPDHEVSIGSLSILSSTYNDRLSKDYRKLRHELMNYVIDNYQEMPIEDLKQAASHFCTPPDIINMFFSPVEQMELGEEFHKKATHCRRTRFDSVVTSLFNHLEYEESGEIIESLNDYIWKYIELGVEGTTEMDPVGLFDYFTSTSGTIFENNGFIEKNFQPRHNLSLTQLRDFVMDILHNGYTVAIKNYPQT
jgi:hypothetical protein